MATSANTIYNAPLIRRKAKRSLYEATPVQFAPERSHVFDSPSAMGPAPVEPTRPAI